MAIVYKITSPRNRVYIGSSKNKSSRRWNSYMNLNCKSQPRLYRSLKKHSPQKHLFEVIWEGNNEERFKYETYYGKLFECLDKQKGLNCFLPKEFEEDNCISESVRNKMIKAKKEIPLNKEHKDRISLNSQNKRRVVSINNNHEILNKWDSLKSCAVELSIDPSSVTKCCNLKLKSVKGYILRYEGEESKVYSENKKNYQTFFRTSRRN